jgi:signal transduction histidine kinase
MNEFLLLTIRYFFLIIALWTVVNLIRYRDQARLDIALMFGATAVVILMLTIPESHTPSWLRRYIASLAVVAQPYLLLRLVPHFREVSRRIQTASLFGMIIAGIVLLISVSPRPLALTLVATTYFVLVEGYAVSAFVLGALTTRGVTRWRLSLIAAGSTLFALTMLLVTFMLFVPQTIVLLTPLGVLFLMVAIVCYYLGLSTPCRLQQVWQEAELRRFLDKIQHTPQAERLIKTGDILCESAVRAVGGTTAVIAHHNQAKQQWQLETTEPILPAQLPEAIIPKRQKPFLLPTIKLGLNHTDTQTTFFVPLVANEQEWGMLLVLIRRTPLFVDNDLALLKLLADQAAFILSYETIMDEKTRTVQQLRSLQNELEQRVADRTAELSQANKELARTARAKDEFLASMSHELRTPLNAIMSLTEIIEEGVYGSVTDKQNHALHTIKESSQHLLDLINDILDVAKIEAGKLTLDLQPQSVQLLCTTSLRFVREEALKKKIELELRLDEEFKMITADGRRLKQILVNLLSNAIKFTPEGGHVCLQTIGNSVGSVAHFSISDTGVGITPAQMQRLFHGSKGPQAFVQLDSSLARQHNGSGLGLNLVYRLTELHNGSISATSEPNRGSRFTISLPWQSEDNAWQDSHTYGTSPLIRKDFQQPRTILLAEDNDRNLEVYRDYLAHCGYKVVTACNGHEALIRANESEPDLILMDIQMPEMDGLTAIERLRASHDRATTPIIALTALAMPGDRERCMAAGASDYLSKPIPLKHLTRTIQAHLGL